MIYVRDKSAIRWGAVARAREVAALALLLLLSTSVLAPLVLGPVAVTRVEPPTPDLESIWVSSMKEAVAPPDPDEELPGCDSGGNAKPLCGAPRVASTTRTPTHLCNPVNPPAGKAYSPCCYDMPACHWLISRTPRANGRGLRGKAGLAGHVSSEGEELCGAVMLVRDPACWICDLSSELRLQVDVVTRQAVGSRGSRDVVEILVPPTAREAAIAEIRGHQSVTAAWFSDADRRRLVGIVDSRSCGACRAAQQAGVSVLRLVADGRGNLEWSVMSPGLGPLKVLLFLLQASGCEARIVRRWKPSAPDGATARQREILRAAVEGGYFEEPRGVTQSEIAMRFGVSRIAVLRLLRRAERKGLFLL